MQENYKQIAESGGQKRDMYYVCIGGLQGYAGGSPYTEPYLIAFSVCLRGDVAYYLVDSSIYSGNTTATKLVNSSALDSGISFIRELSQFWGICLYLPPNVMGISEYLHSTLRHNIQFSNIRKSSINFILLM